MQLPDTEAALWHMTFVFSLEILVLDPCKKIGSFFHASKVDYTCCDVLNIDQEEDDTCFLFTTARRAYDGVLEPWRFLLTEPDMAGAAGCFEVAAPLLCEKRGC